MRSSSTSRTRFENRASTLTSDDLGKVMRLLQAGINSAFFDQTNRLSEQVNAMIHQANQETVQRDAKLIEKPVL
eukprot:g48544.t1